MVLNLLSVFVTCLVRRSRREVILAIVSIVTVLVALVREAVSEQARITGENTCDAGVNVGGVLFGISD